MYKTNTQERFSPPLKEWATHNSKWITTGSVLLQNGHAKNPVLESPPFSFFENVYYVARIEFNLTEHSHIIARVVNLDKKRTIKERHQEGSGSFICAIGFYANKGVRYQIRLYNRPRHGKRALFRDLKLSELTTKPFEFQTNRSDTFLDHWGSVNRSIHSLCKKSRIINSFVAYIEMQLGKTEVLSLPLFVGLCPTGRCNAKCRFCSVAENRSGIVKTDMPKEAIEKLVTQIGGTVWMFGLEGNGEPLMYKHIHSLLATIIGKKSRAYLITNGSLLTNDLDCLLASDSIDSINFSINAATSENHVKLTNLNNFSAIKKNVRKIAHCRGISNSPFISVSMVVTSINVHEAIDFIRMAEFLNVDRVYIRSLSEIATSESTIEDMRSIVPYENDIRNLKEEIEDYIDDVGSEVEIIFDYSSFKAVKRNPIKGIIPIKGFENKIIPPNRRYWQYDELLITAKWHLNTLELEWKSKKGAVYQCEDIPVTEQRQLILPISLEILRGVITISIIGRNNSCLITKQYQHDESNQKHECTLDVNTKENDRIRIKIYGEKDSKAAIDFRRLRAYPQRQNRYNLLINYNKWERNSEGLECRPFGSGLKINWKGPKYIYILKSYGIPCHCNEHIKLTAEIHVNSGELGIGILSCDGLKWLATFQTSRGRHDEMFQFNSGENETFHIILYANNDDGLSAELKWNDFAGSNDSVNFVQEQFQKETVSNSQTRGKEEQDGNPDRKSDDALPNYGDQGLSKENKIRPFHANLHVKQYIMKRTKVYCQKPWTDLNTFSVDGRMDICCIATGESQRKYALGNLFENSFQEIWNGPVARKFRETVNDTSKRLPPCSRCPMAYQTQGPFFNLDITKGYLKNSLKVFLLNEIPWLLNVALHFPIAIVKKVIRK